MKNIKKCVFVLLSGLFLFSSLYAKTTINSLKKVNTPARAVVGQVPAAANALQTAVEEKQSPLDEPFAIKHAYPQGKVSTNVVALHLSPIGKDGKVGTNACSGFRLHKRWIVTAAHCFIGFDRTKNVRVTASVKQWPDGVWQVSLSNAKSSVPANATLYFYGKNYTEGTAYSHAEDIALIGLDKEDKAISMLNQQLKQLEASSMQAQQAMAAVALNKAPAFKQS